MQDSPFIRDVASAGDDRRPAVAASAAPTRAAMRLEHLWKTYPGTKQPAVQDLSLDVKDGQVVTLLGPSGCGKTTTLRLVAGLEVPDAGDVLFGERPVVVSSKRFFVPPEKREVGMVFQSYAVWPHMTVAENVAFPLHSHNIPRREIADRVHRVLELVGMSGLEDRPGPLLSGGQQQRVAIARALVMEPTVLELDEPFSNLDAKLREQMRLEVKLLQKRLKMAVLLVTHDQIEALSLSNHIALMSLGAMQQQGSPQSLYEAPANEFVRDFIGKTLLFKGSVQSSNAAGQVAVALDGSSNSVVFGRNYDGVRLRTGERVHLAVRPEDVSIAAASGPQPPDGVIGGVVHTTLFLGDEIEYQVEIEGQGTVMICGDRHDPIDEGSRVWVKLRPDGHSVWVSDWGGKPTNGSDAANPAGRPAVGG